MQVHQLLANDQRTDFVGRDIWIDTSTSDPKQPWRNPEMGFPGRLYVGHRTDVIDPCIVQIHIGEKVGHFRCTTHTWTPIYQKSGYVDSSGMFTVQEIKWIRGKSLCARFDMYHNFPTPVKVRIDLAGDVASAAMSGKPFRVRTATLSLGVSLETNLYAKLYAPREFQIEPRTFVSAHLVIGIGPREDIAQQALEEGLRTPLEKVVAEFEGWFSDRVPVLISEDLDILRLYYYRWFVVYRNLHNPSEWYSNHPMQGTLIYESSVGQWFSAPIGLPLPLQIREVTWMNKPEGVLGTLNAWVENKGALRAYVSDPISSALIYDIHHPNEINLQRLFEAGIEYITTPRARSPRLQGGGLDAFPVTVGSWVTGTEFAPDFFACISPKWDHTASEISITPTLPMPGERDSDSVDKIGHLYRVDTNVFHLSMISSLAKIAKKLGRRPHFVYLEQALADLRRKFEKLHKGPDNVFHSVDAKSQRLILEVINFESVLPFLIDAWDKELRKGLITVLSEHLLAPYGLTTTSQKCIAFSAYNQWAVGPNASVESPFKYPCCWNGPSWNFATSWALLALGRALQDCHNNELSKLFKQIWERWSYSHFLGGNASLPVVMEHYNPYTGEPFRVVPDYFHSAWIDIIIRYILGLRETSLSWLHIDPVISFRTSLALENVPWRGHRIDVYLTPNKGKLGCEVTVDKSKTFKFSSPPPWEVSNPHSAPSEP